MEYLELERTHQDHRAQLFNWGPKFQIFKVVQRNKSLLIPGHRNYWQAWNPEWELLPEEKVIMQLIILLIINIINNNYKQPSLPKPWGWNVLQDLGSALEGVGLRIFMELFFWEHLNPWGESIQSLLSAKGSQDPVFPWNLGIIIPTKWCQPATIWAKKESSFWKNPGILLVQKAGIWSFTTFPKLQKADPSWDAAGNSGIHPTSARLTSHWFYWKI